jgi:hypothetical protein
MKVRARIIEVETMRGQERLEEALYCTLGEIMILLMFHWKVLLFVFCSTGSLALVCLVVWDEMVEGVQLGHPVTKFLSPNCRGTCKIYDLIQTSHWHEQ